MEQKLRFGLDLDQLAVLKKKLADYEPLLEAYFYVFMGKKNEFKKNVA